VARVTWIIFWLYPPSTWPSAGEGFMKQEFPFRPRSSWRLH